MIDCGTVLKKNRAQAENEENNKEFKNPKNVKNNKKFRPGNVRTIHFTRLIQKRSLYTHKPIYCY